MRFYHYFSLFVMLKTCKVLALVKPRLILVIGIISLRKIVTNNSGVQIQAKYIIRVYGVHTVNTVYSVLYSVYSVYNV